MPDVPDENFHAGSNEPLTLTEIRYDGGLVNLGELVGKRIIPESHLTLTYLRFEVNSSLPSGENRNVRTKPVCCSLSESDGAMFIVFNRSTALKWMDRIGRLVRCENCLDNTGGWPV